MDDMKADIAPHDRKLVRAIAIRAAKLDKDFNGRAAQGVMHHEMNVTAIHCNGNRLRLIDLLEADDLNFVHDVFGIDRHIDRDTGRLDSLFVPRFSTNG